MKNKLKALVTAEVISEQLEKNFREQIDFVYDGYAINHEVMPHDELIAKIPGYDLLICEYDTISKDVFDAADRLKMIVCCRGGVKSVIDLESAMEKKVIVCNNAGRNAGAVSDMIIGYVIDITRNISLSNTLIHTKAITQDASSKPAEYQDTVWGLDNDSPFIRFRGRSVTHMTLGIVGAGKVGRELARKMQVFGTKILVYDPYVDDSTLPEYVESVSWDTLLREADIVSVNCPLSPQTRNMFNAEFFNSMKQGSYFINTARGELIDEAALVEALKIGKLSAAAIDVTVREPIPNDSILLEAPNLIITPHIGGSSDDVQLCGTGMIIDCLKSYLNAQKPHNAVVYI